MHMRKGEKKYYIMNWETISHTHNITSQGMALIRCQNHALFHFGKVKNMVVGISSKTHSCITQIIVCIFVKQIKQTIELQLGCRYGFHTREGVVVLHTGCTRSIYIHP